MPSPDAERLAGALWRCLRPSLIRLLDEALVVQDLTGVAHVDEELSAADMKRAADFAARWRGRNRARPAGQAQRKPARTPRRRAKP